MYICYKFIEYGVVVDYLNRQASMNGSILHIPALSRVSPFRPFCQWGIIFQSCTVCEPVATGFPTEPYRSIQNVACRQNCSQYEEKQTMGLGVNRRKIIR